ncbi:MAG TPA: sugar phosphate isomerase/epimerase family protein [bacterium]|nr:sugar phosphate isomerase/epimerase family protein [bacterium]HPP29589.1 sugar phosphate isomerase/epimerase family protein [bacterium]
MDKKIGVINYNISGFSLEELFKWCSENSVGYVELMRKDVWEDITKSENRIKDISNLLTKYGIKISQISSDSDFIQKTEDEFKKQVWMVGEMCKMIKDLGFNQLRIDGGWPKEGVDEKNYRNLVIKGASAVTEIAEKEGVYLALDNHGVVTNNYILLLDVLGTVNSKHLGTNLDTMNYRWYGYRVDKLTEIYKKVAPYALHTHLKDGTGTRETYKGAVLGEGEIPLLDAIKILKDSGYNGVWCVEYEGKEGADGYKKCVEWLKRNL